MGGRATKQNYFFLWLLSVIFSANKPINLFKGSENPHKRSGGIARGTAGDGGPNFAADGGHGGQVSDDGALPSCLSSHSQPLF